MVQLRRTKGFTLLEVLIVLVILAVLAGLAVPAYTTAIEKSRKQEALTALGAVRGSQQRYFAAYNAYAGAYSALDFDPALVTTGNTVHFTFPAIGGGGAGSTTYTATAVRNAVDRPTGVAAYTVTIVQDGTVTSTY